MAVAAASASLKLNVAGQLGVAFTNNPRILTLKADGGKVWYFFTGSVGQTVDETATAASDVTRAFSLDDGERQDWEWDGVGDLYVVTKAAAACKLRIAITSPVGGAG